MALRSERRAYYIKKKGGSDHGKNETKSSSSSSEQVENNNNESSSVAENSAAKPDGFTGTAGEVFEELIMLLIEQFMDVLGLLLPYDVIAGDIAFDLQIEHNEKLDCPCLMSRSEVSSKHSNILIYRIEIYAESGNVQDILEILWAMDIACFNLDAVHETYLAAVNEFLSSLPHLRSISVGEHYLKNDQELVRNVVKSSESLSTLGFRHNTRGEDSDEEDGDVEVISRHLDQGLNEYLSLIHESHQPLQKLDLTKVSNLTTVIIDGLVEAFAASPKIKILDMSVTMYEYKYVQVGISKLAKVLRNNDTLEEWNLGNRTLDNESILECAKLLEDNTSSCLKKLDLHLDFDESSIDPETWISFGKAISKTSSLKYLDVSGHRLSEESWKAFGEGLKANTSLLTFKASKHKRDEEKDTDILLPVFEALRENKTLKSLDLSNFDLSHSFASLKGLELALVENRSLKSLVLANSGMADEGIAILSRSLPQMKGIEKLDLSHHSCTLKGAQAFAEGMKSNYNILYVEIHGRDHRGCHVLGNIPPVDAIGFEREYHEIQYYARMNRKGRRCMGSKTPIDPSLWATLLTKALIKEVEPHPGFSSGDIRSHNYFAGDHDTSIDAVFYLLRDVLEFPVE